MTTDNLQPNSSSTDTSISSSPVNNASTASFSIKTDNSNNNITVNNHKRNADNSNIDNDINSIETKKLATESNKKQLNKQTNNIINDNTTLIIPQPNVHRQSSNQSISNYAGVDQDRVLEYYSILDDYIDHFSRNDSALVWLSRAIPSRSNKLPIPKPCRQPRSSSGQGGYAAAYRALGLTLRDSDTRSGHWHSWYFNNQNTDFNALQVALKKRWKENINYNPNEATQIAMSGANNNNSNNNNKKYLEQPQHQQQHQQQYNNNIHNNYGYMNATGLPLSMPMSMPLEGISLQSHSHSNVNNNNNNNTINHALTPNQFYYSVNPQTGYNAIYSIPQHMYYTPIYQQQNPLMYQQIYTTQQQNNNNNNECNPTTATTATSLQLPVAQSALHQQSDINKVDTITASTATATTAVATTKPIYATVPPSFMPLQYIPSQQRGFSFPPQVPYTAINTQHTHTQQHQSQHPTLGLLNNTTPHNAVLVANTQPNNNNNILQANVINISPQH